MEYIVLKEYDSKIKLDNYDLKCFSNKGLKNYFPTSAFKIIGYVSINQYADENKDKKIIPLGEHKFELLEKKPALNIVTGYILVNDCQVVALVEPVALPIILFIGGIITAFILIGIFFGYTIFNRIDDPVLIPDDHAEYVGTMGYSLGGYVVDENDNQIIGAKITLYAGYQDLATMDTNSTGSFMFRGVPTGYYMLTIEYNGQIKTMLVMINSADETIKIVLYSDAGNSVVDIKTDNGNYAIGDVDKEAETTKDNIVVTLTKKEKISSDVLSSMPAALKTDDLKYKVFNLSAIKNGSKINELENVIQVVIPFTTNNLSKFVIYRWTDNKGMAMSEVKSKDNPVDGTYYIEGNNVIMFVNKMGEYVFVSGLNNGSVTTKTTVGFEEFINVDLATGNVDLYFYHSSADSKLNAVLDLIIYTSTGEEYVLLTSGNIPNGCKIQSLTLDQKVLSKLTSGNYSGLIRARYTNNTGAAADTNIDMPVIFIVR